MKLKVTVNFKMQNNGQSSRLYKLANAIFRRFTNLESGLEADILLNFYFFNLFLIKFLKIKMDFSHMHKVSQI